MTNTLPQIRFRSKENFCSQTKTAAKINKYLAASYLDEGGNGYTVFRLDSGLPAVNVKFEDFSDCVTFGVWLAEKYSPIFDVWEAEPGFDLFRIGQYSIPNGNTVFSVIEQMERIGVVKKGELKFELA